MAMVCATPGDRPSRLLSCEVTPGIRPCTAGLSGEVSMPDSISCTDE